MENAGGNCRESYRAAAVFHSLPERIPIAVGQIFFFPVGSSEPDRTDGMNHIPGRQPARRGGHCLADRETVGVLFLA